MRRSWVYYAKLAAAIIIPISGMLFGMEKTTAPWAVLIFLAIALAAGLLFLFGLLDLTR